MRNTAKRDKPGPITIYGASDDLIEIEGGIREEFNNDGFLVFDDGTVLMCYYSKNGVWRFSVTDSGNCQVDIATCTSEDDDSDCTDVVTIRGDVNKVTFWKNYPPDNEDYEGVLEGLDFGDLSLKTLKAIYELVADKL